MSVPLQPFVTHVSRPASRLPATGSRLGFQFRALDVLLAVLAFFLGANAFTQLGVNSLLWLLCYALIFGLMILRPRLMAASLQANAILLAYPLLCVASTLWSDTPSVSFRFGVQLFVSTFIAVYIGARFTLTQIFWMINSLFIVLFLFSALNYTSVFFHAFDHRQHFVGVFQSKTMLGQAAVIFAGGGGAIAFLMPRVPLVLRVLCLGMLGLVVWMVSISGSATATATFGVTLFGTLVFWGILRSRLVRTGIVLGLTISIAAITLVSAFNGQDPYSFVLESLGRDPTLTGRTFLWTQGMTVFWEHPILGLGAGAFWAAADYANAIIQFQSFYGEGVVSFHNLIVELLVMLGPLGVLVHVLSVGAAVYFMGALALRYTSVSAIWGCVLILTLYAVGQVSTFYYKPHDFTLMLTVALAVAARRELVFRAGA